MNRLWQDVELPQGFRLDYRDTTGSTNDDVREAAAAGAAEGVVIVAGKQDAGRGRRGAAWVSPPGEGLAFSVLLRPRENKALWPRLSLAAGLAVAEAIERLGIAAEVSGRTTSGSQAGRSRGFWSRPARTTWWWASVSMSA